MTNKKDSHLGNIHNGSMSPLKVIPQLKKLGLTVSSPKQYEYVMTNRQRCHWSGETNKEETRKWQGLVKDRWTTLTNFWLDTYFEKTNPKHVISTTVYPHCVKIEHSTKIGDFTELFFLVRNENILIIQYQSKFTGEVGFRPQFGMRHDWAAIGSNYSLKFDPSTNLLLISTSSTDYSGPKFIGIKVSKLVKFIEREKIIKRIYRKDKFRGDDSPERGVYEPGNLVFEIDPNEPVFIIIVIENTIDEVTKLLVEGMNNYQNFWQKTSDPLIDILNNTYIASDNNDWDQALNWVVLSLDSLTMNIRGKGIYAGLHWFPEYWGRDSFISFRGALLVTGQFKMAEEWIRTMINSQDTDSSSPTYGRVPNILQVNVPNPNYETADATGWFIRSIWDLFEYTSLEKKFLSEIWPAIKIAIKGELSRTDELGFLTHGDRETWMDAQTNGVIATPRGNRAVEIQALFFTELDIAQRIARFMGEIALAKELKKIMDKLKKVFNDKFWDSSNKTLYDHLDKDGIPNLQKRPNIIFAITVPLLDNPLITTHQAECVIEDVLTNCLADHGIRSLSKDDPNYHPLHDYGSRKGEEHHDFSYHNGDVWLWLSGPVIEAAIRFGKLEEARSLTEVLIKRVLTRGALGTLGEILDGSDNDSLGHSRGTISQAWSLAELLRIYFQWWLEMLPNMLKLPP
ncbi:MAG: amylo-alpha-1,6-glucosidase [Promethearchaeota archaeon]